MRLLAIILCFSWMSVQAQPLLSSAQIMEGVTVYRDFKKTNTYYYAPGKLKLALKSNVEPIFKLVQLRYTGTFATGDQGTGRFMNIVQFTVRMDMMEKDQLDQLKKSLGPRTVLRPLPIRNVEAYLVAPFGGKYKRIGESGSLQSEGTLGKSSKTSYWTERTFTLRLENHEAELLWNMVQEGQLAVSVNYAFFADAIAQAPAVAETKGSSNFVEEFGEQLEDLLQQDSIPSMQVIKSDAFPIEIDANKYSHLLVREDIDAGIPPAYPALEIQCYDFTDDLRPDLSIKAIEVEATGVNNYPVRLKPFKFTSSKKDEHTLQIRFPYAIKMDKPLRYRIREYGSDGSVNPYSGWTTRDSWTGKIDITTLAAENKFQKRLVEVETDVATFGENNLQELNLFLIYFFKGEIKQLQLNFSANQNMPLQQLHLVYDKGTSVQCLPIWVYQEESKKEGALQILGEDNYFYFNLPEE